MTTPSLVASPESHCQATTLLVFAKKPLPGQVKTRLIPPLGALGAAQLAERLIERTIEMLNHAALGPIEIWTSPDSAHPVFERLIERVDCRLCIQHGQDLGARLWNAVRQASGPVLLIGTDCPAMTPNYLVSALQLLEGQDAVLGPATDGGYVLLGLRRGHASLFDSLPWGSDQVAAITRQRLDKLGWRWSELAPLPDLDRPEDLEALEPGLRTALGLIHPRA